MTPFMYAAVKGHIDSLKLFFELGRPIVNLPDVSLTFFYLFMNNENSLKVILH